MDVYVDPVAASGRCEARSCRMRCFGDGLAVNVRLARLPSMSTSTSTSTEPAVTIGAPSLLALLVCSL
jgi:hypothetical protein